MENKKSTIEKNLSAIENMTDLEGILQHESNPEHDYSIDDQARALIVLSRFSNDFKREGLAKKYLDYITEAKRPDGWFNNYKDPRGNWMKIRRGIQQTPDTLQDCYGRALWALSEFLSSEYREELKEKAEELFFGSLENTEKLTYPHSLAFTNIALSKLPKSKQNRKIKKINYELAKELIGIYKENNWTTYCVARIPQAMLLAGQALGERRFRKSGESSLNFIIKEYFNSDGIFRPAKNPFSSEQPVEAGVMVEACIDAYQISKKEEYQLYAKKAFDWFEGDNFAGKSLLADNGAVYDAIEKDGSLNSNQGAESIIAYMMALSKIRELK